MEDLITAVNQAIDELEDRYDGAPDSKTLWLGSIIVDLREAASKAERDMAAWQIEQEENRMRRRP
jgi:hypothetical protein